MELFRKNFIIDVWERPKYASIYSPIFKISLQLNYYNYKHSIADAQIVII